MFNILLCCSYLFCNNDQNDMQRTAVMQLEPDCSLLPEQLRGCRLVLACVSVGNVGQLAVDVVLATLSRQQQLTLVSQVPRHPASNSVNPHCYCSGSPPGGYPGVRVGPPGHGGRRPQLRHAALPLPRLPAGRAAAQVLSSTRV